MKKSSINNKKNKKINNLKNSKHIINMDNKNNTKNNERDISLAKKAINNIKNINNKKNIKTANISNTKSIQQNLEYIPTIIFNINPNKISLNSIDNKSKIKSKSNENSKSNKSNKIINFKKSSIINKTIKKAKEENVNIKNNLHKANIQIHKQLKNNSGSTLVKKNINRRIIQNNNINIPNLNFSNNKKQNETFLSLGINKRDLFGPQFINIINKKNFNTNFKTSPITTKNSEKSSKEKTNTNKINKKNVVNNKNKDNIKCKFITKKMKISKNKKEISSKNYLKTFIKKFSNININKEKLKNKNNIDLSNSKIIATKNISSNLSNLSNFSINFLTKSLANKKGVKKSNIYKTKIGAKHTHQIEKNKTTNNYFENISNQNIIPITISNYKNNYVNINININNKKNLKKNSNNTFYVNSRITKCKISDNKVIKNIKNKIKTKDLTKKTVSKINKTKIANNTNTKYKIKESLTNKIANLLNNTNLNKLQYKQITYFNLKKVKNPLTYTTSLIQNQNQNNTYNNKKNFKNIEINPKNNNQNSSIITTKDYHYYQQESLKLINTIKIYGIKHNYKSYPKTDMNYYKIGRNIGHGAFGKVNIALHILSGHIVAIKSFNKIKKSFPLNRIYYEIKLLKKLRNHKNIIKYFEHFETEKYFCIVMENISGGNLLNAINKMSKFSESMARNIFKQLIQTIKYLHNMNIVHRDIKPDNILLELDNTIKLCDFGVSKQIKKGQLLTDTCGTPAFIAPEILKEKPYNPYITDIWSSGVVLYIIVSGFFPFRGNNETELRKNIINGNFPKLNDISENLKDLLDKLLEINPEKRITIDKILKHPWLNEDLERNENINNNNINIFTKAEKIIYGKLKLDYRLEHKENVLENFTYKNILTEYEEENMNVKTISFIKTPYNSQRPRDDDEDLFYEDINIENDIMNFFMKVGEKNREYELRNNYEFDQGIIIDKRYNNKQKLMNSKNNSFEKENNKQDKSSNNILLNNDNNNENNNINDDKDKNNNYDDNNKVIKINEKAIGLVESFGYNRKYIINSLQSNEINHAIASYYLILSLLNE